MIGFDRRNFRRAQGVATLTGISGNFESESLATLDQIMQFEIGGVSLREIRGVRFVKLRGSA